MRIPVAVVVACWVGAAASAQQISVLDSPHNLSVSGTGQVHATIEDQVCIFCHTPHNAAPVRPLWNRQMPTSGYTIYTSRSLDATPGQPTGMSKMCLSCHDGTIALGSVLSRTDPIQMADGVTTMPTGPSNLGTSLADDHPISFRYDSALAARDPKIKNPGSLPSEIRLDSNSELQCTSCHDAHNNAFGNFLVMPNTSSQLCTSCHQVGTTTVSGHADCSSCHQSHTAPSGPYLLKRANITQTCLRCHDGTVSGAANISTDVNKISNHDTASPVDPPDPQIQHTTCVSCHDPHTMGSGAGVAPSIHPNFGRIAGVNASGSPVSQASYEFEVCFTCHADGNTRTPTIGRRIVQNNTRLEFSPSAVSYHPVEVPGRNSDVPSLRAPWTAQSVLYCSDCHNADTSHAAGGTGPNGVHGSDYTPTLLARYDTADFTTESAAAYALCYKCHDRSRILSEQSPFKYHPKHVQEKRTPCAACHDAHGISSTQGTLTNNAHLINFATAIVQPLPSNGQLIYNSTGTSAGNCTLRCHSTNHSNYRYP